MIVAKKGGPMPVDRNNNNIHIHNDTALKKSTTLNTFVKNHNGRRIKALNPKYVNRFHLDKTNSANKKTIPNTQTTKDKVTVSKTTIRNTSETNEITSELDIIFKRIRARELQIENSSDTKTPLIKLSTSNRMETKKDIKPLKSEWGVQRKKTQSIFQSNSNHTTETKKSKETNVSNGDKSRKSFIKQSADSNSHVETSISSSLPAHKFKKRAISSINANTFEKTASTTSPILGAPPPPPPPPALPLILGAPPPPPPPPALPLILGAPPTALLKKQGQYKALVTEELNRMASSSKIGDPLRLPTKLLDMENNRLKELCSYNDMAKKFGYSYATCEQLADLCHVTLETPQEKVDELANNIAIEFFIHVYVEDSRVKMQKACNIHGSKTYNEFALFQKSVKKGEDSSFNGFHKSILKNLGYKIGITKNDTQAIDAVSDFYKQYNIKFPFDHDIRRIHKIYVEIEGDGGLIRNHIDKIREVNSAIAFLITDEELKSLSFYKDLLSGTFNLEGAIATRSERSELNLLDRLIKKYRHHSQITANYDIKDIQTD